MTFDDLPLIGPLRKSVAAAHYTTPTPIQEAAIPIVLRREDLLATAQTGTGKTAAFALPILQMLSTPQVPAHPVTQPLCLVLTPTRELAQQIFENFQMYGQGLPLRSVVIYGGVSQIPQVTAIEQGCDILIACPGRLNDLIAQHILSLDSIRIFVLDEADRMLDMGFIHDVQKIVKLLPEKHQSLLFSATMPQEVQSLAAQLLRRPKEVHVDPVSSPAKAVEQCMYYVDKTNKKHLLAWVLKQPDVENALVFSRTKHGCDRIVRDLKRQGIDAVAIHGDKSQGARQTALNRFKSGDCPFLIATDIAARGLDIEGLSHVINFDLPNEPESYIHRIGRTGRAGHTGKAITFCCIDEVKQLGQVEKLLGFRLPEKKSDWPMQITEPTPKTAVRPQALPKEINRQGQAVTHHARAFTPGKDRITVSKAGFVQAQPRKPLAQPVHRVNRKKANKT